MQKIRQWNNEYVKYEFTGLIESGKNNRVQCMNYHYIMCNSNLKPCRLVKHLEKYPNNGNTSIDNFCIKRARYDQRGKIAVVEQSLTL
ncbi:hypothetical protein A3Q56_01258 [Intoshia linei]|uniref:Uncharacterized protein n=1 Tax=Intoshia linei TaxID=1819745 RepID=A0A177B9U2_9BILA|nr:hypothetical protein A3Q56_01258 [Intoshia linei]